MKSIGIRKAIQLFGGTKIDIHKSYHCQSGFFDKDGKDGYNQWDFVRIINSMGYKIDKFTKEKERY